MRRRRARSSVWARWRRTVSGLGMWVRGSYSLRRIGPPGVRPGYYATAGWVESRSELGFFRPISDTSLYQLRLVVLASQSPGQLGRLELVIDALHGAFEGVVPRRVPFDGGVSGQVHKRILAAVCADQFKRA